MRYFQNSSILCVAVVALGLALVSIEAHAAKCDADDKECLALQSKLEINADILFFYNPLGGVGMMGLVYNKPYSYSDTFETTWSHLQAGAVITASPAISRLNAHLEWMPVGFFKLRAYYAFMLFHGVWGSVLNYDSKEMPFDESDIYDRKGDEQLTTGHLWALRPTLQARWRFLSFVNRTNLVWSKINADGPYIFFWRYETLVKPEDFIVDSQTMVFFELYKGEMGQSLILGPLYTIMYPKGSRLRRQQLGVMAYAEPWGRTQKLGTVRLYLQLLYNIEEANRQNELFFMIGVGTTWDSF